MIAAELVAKAEPDGYALFLSTNTVHSGNPHLFKKLPCDPINDFTSIARICNFLFILAVPADQPICSFGNLKAYAKAQLDKVSFGFGNSTGQIAGPALSKLTGLNALAVPYKSTPQALTALGADVSPGTSVELRTCVRQPLVGWRDKIKTARIQPG